MTMPASGKRSRLSKVIVTEISLVDRPANQHSNVLLAKRDEGQASGGMQFSDALARMTGPRMFNDLVRVEKAGSKPVAFNQALSVVRSRPAVRLHKGVRLPEPVAIAKKRPFDESKIDRDEKGRFADADGIPSRSKKAREFAGRVGDAGKRLAESAVKAAGETLSSVRATRINPIAGGGVQVELRGKDPTGKIVYIRHQVRAENLGEDSTKGKAALVILEEGLRIFGNAEVQPSARRTTVRRVRPSDQPDFREGRAYDYATPGVGEAAYRPASEQTQQTQQSGYRAPNTDGGGTVPISGNTYRVLTGSKQQVEASMDEAQKQAARAWEAKRSNVDRFSFQGGIVEGHTYKNVPVPPAPTQWVSGAHKMIDEGNIPQAYKPSGGTSTPTSPSAPKLNTGNRAADLQALAPRRTQEDKDFINRFGQANQLTPPPGSPKWSGEIAPATTYNGFRIPEGPTDWQAKAKDFVDGRKGRDGDGDGVLNEGKKDATGFSSVSSTGAVQGTSRPLAPSAAPKPSGSAAASLNTTRSAEPIEAKHWNQAEIIHAEAHDAAMEAGYAPGSDAYTRLYEKKTKREIERIEESRYDLDAADIRDKVEHLATEQTIASRFG